MPYHLVGHDNHIELFRGCDEVVRCPSCEVPTHPFDHGFSSQEVPKHRDLSSCFEGFELASPRLKLFLERSCTSPVEYHETAGGYYVLRPLLTIFEELSPGCNVPGNNFCLPPDADEFCEVCGRFNAFYAKPIGILPGQKTIGDFDLFRSAQQYGPKMGKTFFMIAGDGLVQAMKRKGFNGATYVPF